ncbi:MAG TPA: HEAT repeat domain-containing protein [Vicinamibacterales bacterium]|nr:HEAT repeat domain-containing protein [Vicinamibacterales bacterium]
MNAKHLLMAVVIFTGGPAAGAALAQPEGFVYEAQERDAAERAKARADEARQRETERGDRVYDEAMRHIYESRWERAVERFNDVLTMKGAKVDAALYWKAYAQDRLGQRAEALTTIGILTRDHQASRYLQQARALEAEVRRNAGQPVRPQDQADEDLKLMAIAALQNSAPEQAIPMLEKLLQGTASPKLKERALFVLAQSNSPQAREVLKGIAKGNSTPELQSRAIMYLGQHGGRESRAVLAEIYSATTDIDSKKRILRALAMGGEKDRILAAAQSEQNAELRGEAVRQLGMHGGHAELSQLYAKETAPEIKKLIISAMAMGGNATRLSEIARTEQNPELRRSAIRSLGMIGSKGSGDTLVGIYSGERDVDVKKTVISALAMQNNDVALVALARKESDPALKRDIVARLSHMNSKVATDYMLEILNGK